MEDKQTLLHHVHKEDVEWLKEHFAFIDVNASEVQQTIIYRIPEWVLLLERTVKTAEA